MSKEEKKPFKPRGGRNKVDEELALSHRLKINLNKSDFDQVNKAYEESGSNSMAEYLRQRIINTKDLYVNNPKEILKTLDKIGTEVSRIGNNINQLAKYANILAKDEKYKGEVIEDLNTLLRQYSKERKELALGIRALLKKR